MKLKFKILIQEEKKKETTTTLTVRHKYRAKSKFNTNIKNPKVFNLTGLFRLLTGNKKNVCFFFSLYVNYYLAPTERADDYILLLNGGYHRQCKMKFSIRIIKSSNGFSLQRELSTYYKASCQSLKADYKLAIRTCFC